MASDHPTLDHIIWNCLSGPQSHLAEGTGSARRFARGLSPIAGFEDRFNPDFDVLADLFDVGEAFYVDAWSGPTPAGWNLDLDTTMIKMVYEGEAPLGRSTDWQQILPEHAGQALELAVLTNPGPFGIRTIEFGDYIGSFEGDRLVAMAGARMHCPPYREISGVCTHPDYQGRGLAKGLMLELASRFVNRGEVPFLHVASKNEVARGLYGRMGFREYLETTVRVLSKLP